MKDRSVAAKAGIDGLLLKVRRADSTTAATPAATPLTIDLDYRRFRNAYGGDWGSRLTFVALPECVLTTPGKPECQKRTPVTTRNNAATDTLTATVVPPAAPRSSRASAAAPAMVLAAAAGAQGTNGDYRATSLSPSGAWQGGGASGDFSWSYPMDIPASLGGPGPSLALSYSSASVDGRTSATSQQASWVGDGWDLGSNFIERTYLPCAEDRKEGSGHNNPKNPTGDLCQGPPMVTMSLNGSSTQLVLSDKDKTWRPAADDGSRVELKTGAIGNGDKETEYWVVTDAKGVQYHFGRHRLPGWDAADPDQRTITNSTWNVPVYGNHPGEPCYKAAYAEAVCDQAWRWNLDYVVDPRGNVMTYWYTKERNHYGSNVQEDGKSTSRPYDRGGWLKKISYGLREENPFAPAPAQVTFGIGERCLKTTAFKCEEDKLTAEATPEVARNWPDVPADQLCDAGKECKDRYAPAFFTRKLLTGVHTWVLKDGKPEPVDSWTLTQDFPSTGDGGVNGEYPLWLSQIRHTGKNGTPISLPPVVFKGKQLPNRVDNNADGNPPYLRWRVETITTETGARIAVEYAEPECSAKAPKKLPSAPESNTLRCYPVVLETPDPTDPTGRKKLYKTDWFHKHRVDEIREEDARNISPTKKTRYEYLGTPAWAYDDESENVSEKVRTWSQWRGYERVRTLVGSAPDKRSLVENRYFRGMNGDKQPAEPGGRRSATIEDSEGGKAPDQEEFAGQVRETLYYNGEDGSLQSTTLYTPWRHGPTATRTREGASPLEAWVQGTTEVASRTILSGDRGQRRTKVQHKFDERGLLQHTTDHGDLSKSDDDSCVRYEYLEDTKQWIIALQTRIETTAKSCDATDVKRPADVIDDKRLHYDTKGNVDRAESLSAYTDGKPVYSLTGTTTVDTYGRPTSATDIYGKTTRTEYDPPSGSVATKIVTTNVLGHASATEIDPGRGLVLAQEDANKRRNVMQYDALGRLTKVWSPDRNPTTQIPDAEFSYDVRPDGPVVITNKKLLERGDYRVSHDIYDGLLRLRQTQQEAIDGGRAITDTFYDSRGLVWKENGAYFNDKEPEPQLWDSDDNKVPSSTRTEFDGMGRPIATIARKFGVETWRTTTSYGGDWVAVDPPRGDTPTKSVLDAKGRKTQLQQFKGESPTGTAFDRTGYKYNPLGRLESVTDQAGNVWSYKYDLRGRVYETRDPDKGTTTVTYDKGDRVETVSDGRTPRRKIAFSYDELGRPKATYEGSVATGKKLTEQTYDTLPGGLGMPVASTRYVDGNAYTQAVTGYDAEYRPMGSKITIPASEGKLAGDYTYTNTYTKTVGLSQTVTHPAAGGLPSERVGFGYHGFDQVTGMSVAGKNFVSTTDYTSLGDVVRTHIGTFAQQLLSTHEFDEQTRRPIRTVHDQESTVGDAVVTTRISDTRTAYDQVGNVLKITDAQGPNPTPATTDTQCFTYDHQRRMTDAWTATDDCAAKPTGVSAGPKVGGPDPYWHSYTFDAVGNRQTEVRHDPGGNTAKDITREYTYAKGLPTGSRLESVLTKGPQGERKDAFEYDGAGNTTKRTVDNTAAPGTGPEVDPAPQILSWDVEGHLEQVEKGSETTSYVYDAGGNRLIRRDASGTTLYLPGTEVKLGKDGNVAKGTRYYTHPAGPTMVRTAEGGKITTSYLLPDRNGTATTSVEAVSKSVTRRKFTPFGEARGAKPSTWPGERGYLGGTMDESTGLTHLGAREYDPSLGRFISVDPQMDMAESQTMNPYAYGNNSPVTFSDPTGRAFCADEACRVRVPVGGGSSGGGGGGDNGTSNGSGGSDSGSGAVPPAPAKPVPTVSQEDVERARLLKQQSKMDAVKRIAMEVLKDASGYNDVVSCIGGDLGTCAMLALEAAVPWAGKAKRIVKALDRAWSAYNKWEDEVRWAIGTMRRADQDAAAMAKYAEDMKSWKKKADSAKAAKKADEAAAEAAKKADSGGGGDGGGGGASCPINNSFTPETKVLLADGTAKAIKDLKPGDQVQATDPKTGKTQAKTVDATIKGKGAKHLVKVTVDVDGTKGTKTSTVTATDGHPFWVPELADWIDATDLKPGQWLQTGAGTRIQITAVKRWTHQATVHNLTVGDYHTYYVLAGAAPILVHNCNLSARAEEIHAAEPDEFVRKNVSTVAVIKADTPHGPINVVAGSGEGLTPAQMSAIGKGEIVADNIPDTHAEQNALLFINQMGWTPISGGTSRNVCLRRCAPLIRGTGGKMMGEVQRGNGKTTTRQRSFEW